MRLCATPSKKIDNLFFELRLHMFLIGGLLHEWLWQTRAPRPLIGLVFSAVKVIPHSSGSNLCTGLEIVCSFAAQECANRAARWPTVAPNEDGGQPSYQFAFILVPLFTRAYQASEERSGAKIFGLSHHIIYCNYGTKIWDKQHWIIRRRMSLQFLAFNLPTLPWYVKLLSSFASTWDTSCSTVCAL